MCIVPGGGNVPRSVVCIRHILVANLYRWENIHGDLKYFIQYYDVTPLTYGVHTVDFCNDRYSEYLKPVKCEINYTVRFKHVHNDHPFTQYEQYVYYL